MFFTSNMMHIILIIFSFFALTYAMKESPLFDKPRIFLIGLNLFFYQLFSCYFCLGFYAGLIVYLLIPSSWNITHFDLREMFMYGLASSGISFILNAVVDRLLVFIEETKQS